MECQNPIYLGCETWFSHGGENIFAWWWKFSASLIQAWAKDFSFGNFDSFVISIEIINLNGDLVFNSDKFTVFSV